MNSEGNEADFGVWRGGSTGRATAGMVMSTTRESKCPKPERLRRIEAGDRGLTDTSAGKKGRAVKREEREKDRQGR